MTLIKSISDIPKGKLLGPLVRVCRMKDGFCLFYYYLFFSFDCSLEIFERKDCLYMEGKWVRHGPTIIFGGKMGIKILFLYVLLFYFFIFYFFAFDCSLEMFERKDCLYLEGKGVRENGNKKKNTLHNGF
ncbi:hypothetical protein ACB092_07G054400 [Castanea dentata]